MIVHGNKKISEMVYARLAKEGGGAVRLTNMIRGPQVVFGDLYPFSPWLTATTCKAILGAFGVSDGTAVIKATNQYLNVLAASDRDKATALAALINEDPMMVCSLGLEPQGVTMPIRIVTNAGGAYVNLGYKVTSNNFRAELGFDKNAGSTDPFGFCKRNGDTEWFTSYGSECSCYIGTSGALFSLGYGTAGVKRDIIIETTSTGKVRYGVNTTTLTEKNFNGSLTTDPGKFCLFTMDNDAAMTKNRVSNGTTYWYAKLYQDGNCVREAYPFIRNGVNGFIDVIGGGFYPNANNVGTLTIAYTRNGQPWTPSTP